MSDEPPPQDSEQQHAVEEEEEETYVGVVNPSTSEDAYDEAVDMISDTDWSLPTKVLRESTQAKFYSFFGQTVRAQPSANNATTAGGGGAGAPEEEKKDDTQMIDTSAK